MRAKRSSLKLINKFVDALVLSLHLQGQFMAIWEGTSDHGPQHSLLCKGVRKHEAIDPDQERAGSLWGGHSKVRQKLMQLDVVSLLAT
jgi:hypothetical protein